MTAEQKESIVNNYQINNNLPQRGGSFQAKLMQGSGMAPIARNASQLQHVGVTAVGQLDGSGGPEIENLINKLSQSQMNKGAVRQGHKLPNYTHISSNSLGVAKRDFALKKTRNPPHAGSGQLFTEGINATEI